MVMDEGRAQPLQPLQPEEHRHMGSWGHMGMGGPRSCQFFSSSPSHPSPGSGRPTLTWIRMTTPHLDQDDPPSPGSGLTRCQHMH